MTKRPSLADRARKPSKAEETTAASKQVEAPKRARREYRSILAKVDDKTHAQLRIMGIEQDQPVGDLLVEALNLLFEKHGKPQIARKIVA
ncbi:ribbon-helix-helix domain-containing protein [Fulvimarina sp. 2208YS6-2-32]|uniref:Ribbon-helix-helix domain-containing protein n=1 Tax=Fulvimarina uroteuthidis TaxID=3098149 RepID=A0ABU5I8M9_9HYPH|nr:ribbon-helix-helix domain-containing protein [Fulvimarina sp. 2208YS6-2-32]MDY8111173.1 ribbon-helix-helix domain-containing protein [Fulvimarina sp. 2208YS6-2-32]